MASVKNAPPLDEGVAVTPSAGNEAWTKGWKPSAIVADIATLGTGTVVAGLFNVALVFVVPKLISVEGYGYWKMFGLYAGYMGFLHFGFADGALLRWAGRPMEEFHHEIGPAVKYLFWQHVIVLVPLCTIAAVALRGPFRVVGIAVALYAVIYNEVTILLYGLQSAKIFRPVAIATFAAPALFLGFALLWRTKWQSDYREIIGLYASGWLIVMIFLLAQTKPWTGGRSGVGLITLAKECLLSGWPIMAASTGVMLIISADRLAVSWAASIQNFAQYSLAASAMAVPITAISACSKVFFPHLAAVTPEGRRRIYGLSSRMLLMVWVVLLPFYFALDLFIRHFLPKYLPSLMYARIMLLGIPFLAVIQILQMSYAYLHGTQKQFLGRTMVALAVSLGLTSLAAFHAGSLRIVAGAQVAVLGAWWLFNEWTLRDLTGQGKGDWMRLLAVYAVTGGSYWLTTTPSTWDIPILLLLYYGCATVVLMAGFRSELRLSVRMLSRKESPI